MIVCVKKKLTWYWTSDKKIVSSSNLLEIYGNAKEKDCSDNTKPIIITQALKKKISKPFIFGQTKPFFIFVNLVHGLSYILFFFWSKAFLYIVLFFGKFSYILLSWVSMANVFGLGQIKMFFFFWSRIKMFLTQVVIPIKA